MTVRAQRMGGRGECNGVDLMSLERSHELRRVYHRGSAAAGGQACGARGFERLYGG